MNNAPRVEITESLRFPKGKGKVVCPEYLDFIRGKSCLVSTCRRPPPSDPDHLRARGSGSAKQNDFTAIPLCRMHHAMRHQIGNEKFEERFMINLWREVFELAVDFLIQKTDAEGRG